jgi:hypothetical protein
MATEYLNLCQLLSVIRAGPEPSIYSGVQCQIYNVNNLPVRYPTQ